MIPPAFYQDAFSRFDPLVERGVEVLHGFQTNGTLLNRSWCDFFRQHNVHVGVSIDGPAFLHDATRVDRRGVGTFGRVMKGIALLQENDINFSVIAVLTDKALQYPDEIWGFFHQEGITNIAFNIEEIEGVNLVSSLDVDDGETKYSRFLRRILALSRRYPEVRIREFKSVKEVVLGLTNQLHLQENQPGGVFSFDIDGNISSFSPELLSLTHPTFEHFRFGNVHQHSFSDVVSRNNHFARINSEIQLGIEQCRQTCEYFSLCGGGPPVNKLCENGTFVSAETLFCRLRIKVTTDLILDDLEAETRSVGQRLRDKPA